VLLLPQLDDVAPEVALAVDVDEAGSGHGSMLARLASCLKDPRMPAKVMHRGRSYRHQHGHHRLLIGAKP
jgi:hypothetical protein